MQGETVESRRDRVAWGGVRPMARRTGGERAVQAAVCLLLAGFWLMTGPAPLFSQDAPASSRGKAIAGSSAGPRTRSGNNSTSPTAARPRSDLSKVFQLGDLGGNWVNIYVAKLRGEMGQVNSSVDGDQITHLTMVGLIRIESEKFTLECENLNYDNTEATRQLTARYNVHVDLHEQGVKADCGLLVYDLVKNVITLTVDPYVIRQTPKGETEFTDWNKFTITLRKGNNYDFNMEGDKGRVELKPKAGTTTKTSDHPTTPAGPREINPSSIGATATKTATPTPNPSKK